MVLCRVELATKRVGLVQKPKVVLGIESRSTKQDVKARRERFIQANCSEWLKFVSETAELMSLL
jgi:hypothetical protein